MSSGVSAAKGGPRQLLTMLRGTTAGAQARGDRLGQRRSLHFLPAARPTTAARSAAPARAMRPRRRRPPTAATCRRRPPTAAAWWRAVAGVIATARCASARRCSCFIGHECPIRGWPHAWHRLPFRRSPGGLPGAGGGGALRTHPALLDAQKRQHRLLRCACGPPSAARRVAGAADPQSGCAGPCARGGGTPRERFVPLFAERVVREPRTSSG